MIKNKRNKYCVLIMLILICLSIGYAVLNSDFLIYGKSNIEKNTWDVHLENVKLKRGSATNNLPEITGNSITTTVTLDKPGDYYGFTFDIVNGGTLDAIIDNIEVTFNTDHDPSGYLSSDVLYGSGDDIDESQILFAGESKQVKVIVTFRADVAKEDLPDKDVSIGVTYKVVYAQTNINTYIVALFRDWHPIPGMTISEAVDSKYNEMSSIPNHGYPRTISEYKITNPDVEHIFVDDDGKIINIENTIIESGKSYESTHYSSTLNIPFERITSGNHITTFIDVSELLQASFFASDTGGGKGIPVFTDSSDTYLDVMYSIFPDGILFASPESVQSLIHELIGEYIFGVAGGQELGCTNFTYHRFFAFVDENGKLLKMTDTVKHLDKRTAVVGYIDNRVMTWEEAVERVENSLNDILNNTN